MILSKRHEVSLASRLRFEVLFMNAEDFSHLVGMRLEERQEVSRPQIAYSVPLFA
jgi:hypothetical protein